MKDNTKKKPKVDFKHEHSPIYGERHPDNLFTSSSNSSKSKDKKLQARYNKLRSEGKL